MDGIGRIFTILPGAAITTGKNENARFGVVERGVTRSIWGGLAGGGWQEHAVFL